MGYLENIKIHAGVQKRVEIIFSQAVEEDFISEFKEFSIDGFRCFSARLTNSSVDYYIGYVAFDNEYSTAVDLAIENFQRMLILP